MTLTFTAAEKKALSALAAKRRMTLEAYAKALVLEAISPPTVTAKQVAEVARVTPMTVSFVLNDVPGEVSEATKKRVLAIAKKLGWRPSLTAQSLTRKRV